MGKYIEYSSRNPSIFCWLHVFLKNLGNNIVEGKTVGQLILSFTY